jgi:hypothetical protein
MGKARKDIHIDGNTAHMTRMFFNSQYKYDLSIIKDTEMF